MKYAYIIEKYGNGFSAYVPDLPGCVAAGDTSEEVAGLIEEAIAFHLEGSLDDSSLTTGTLVFGLKADEAG